MARLRGADPVVIAALELAPIVGECSGHAVDPLAWRDATARRRLNDGLAVLVHAHEEMHLTSSQAMIAGDAVRANLFQRVAQVGIAIGVIDGGGEVELRHYACSSASR